MRWNAVHGKHLDALLDFAREGRRTAIDTINDAPTLYPWLKTAVDAFFCLHRSRHIQVGMNGAMPQPIAFSEIVSYHAALDPGYDLPDFIRLVQSADSAWLSAPRPKPASAQQPAPQRKIWTPPRR